MTQAPSSKCLSFKRCAICVFKLHSLWESSLCNAVQSLCGRLSMFGEGWWQN